MNPYVQKLGQYLKEHPFDGGERKIDNVLDYLAECYLEDNPVSSKQIKLIQEEMGPYYENVSFAVSEQLFQLVYDLCSASENAAFREGLMVGLHLQNTITGTDGKPI